MQILQIVMVALITATASAREFRMALSVSPFTELLLSNGVIYSDGATTARSAEELQRLYMKYGANEVYARLATTRTYEKGFGDHSLNRVLDRARMARVLNLPLNPELGLFNIYGDVRCQPSPDFHEYPELKMPGPWTSLSLDEMLPVLRSYSAIIARTILATGVKVQIWDIGNEVDFGAAGVAVRPLEPGCDDTAGGPGWYQPPDRVDPAIGKMSVRDLIRLPEADRIQWLRAHVWRYLARILAAVAAGVRLVDTGARFSTHVSGITAVLPAQAVAFYEALRGGGFLPDQLGFSFYPSSSDAPPDRLHAFENALETVHQSLNRPVFIAEFGYPSRPVWEGEFATWNHALDPYPLTEIGQAILIRHLVEWGLTDGLSGIRPWAPEVIAPDWAPFAFFKANGQTALAKPSLQAMTNAVTSRK
jgi:hypothetical protein